MTIVRFPGFDPSTALRSAQDEPPTGAQDGVQALLNVVFGEYRPNQVVAYAVADEGSVIPLLEERVAEDGKATAYVCQHFACQMPVTEAEALKNQLNS